MSGGERLGDMSGEQCLNGALIIASLCWVFHAKLLHLLPAQMTKATTPCRLTSARA